MELDPGRILDLPPPWRSRGRWARPDLDRPPSASGAEAGERRGRRGREREREMERGVVELDLPPCSAS